MHEVHCTLAADCVTIKYLHYASFTFWTFILECMSSAVFHFVFILPLSMEDKRRTTVTTVPPNNILSVCVQKKGTG